MLLDVACYTGCIYGIYMFLDAVKEHKVLLIKMSFMAFDPELCVVSATWLTANDEWLLMSCSKI